MVIVTVIKRLMTQWQEGCVHARLEAGAAILDLIDRKRAVTGDTAAGETIEQIIICRCLWELQAASFCEPEGSERPTLDGVR
jgi:hypothetical protein